MNARYIDDLSEEGAKRILKEIIEHLDAADEMDLFGTEGWRHYMGLED